MNKKETSWDAVAGWYDDLIEGSSDSFQNKVILPNLLRIIDLKPSTTVLDVACGQGFFARALESAGAKVTASDISSELITLARGHLPKTIEFHVASADSLQFAKDSSFDVVTVILSIQNIENLQGTLAECARVLNKNGRLVIVMNHPAFRIPQRSSWNWDEKVGRQYRRIDSYLSDAQLEIDMTPGESDPTRKTKTLSFHRPLQSYFKALNKCGFAVSRLEEWISHKKSQAGPRGLEEDRVRKEIPMFLMLEAVKK